MEQNNSHASWGSIILCGDLLEWYRLPILCFHDYINQRRDNETAGSFKGNRRENNVTNSL